VIVLSQHDRARDAAVNLLRFFADESCGQCTPCRVGTEKAVALMTEPRWDTALLGELAQAMADASICGLGQAAPIRSPRSSATFQESSNERRRVVREVRFRLNGVELAAAANETIIAARSATASRFRISATHRNASGRQLPGVHGGDQGRAPARPVVLPHSGTGDGGVEHHRARRACAEARRRDARADVPERVYKPDSELAHWRRRLAIGKPRFAPARSRRRTSRTPRWRSISTPASSARAACAPAARSRSRRHRLRVPRRSLADRVRPGRSDGRVDLCGLRRMRAGLPHGRARSGEGRLSRNRRQEGGVGLPVLRRSAASSPTTSRTTRSSASRGATVPPTTSACASRGVSASTTCAIRSG